MHWFDPVYTRFECARYISNRITAVRTPTEETGVYTWRRGIHAGRPEDVQYVNGMFERYDMYVTGFTFAWDRFSKEIGLPPSLTNWNGYSEWLKEKLKPNFKDYINTKDIVWEIDRKAGHGLLVAGEYGLKIRDALRSLNIKDFHMLFSGKGGYHIVIEDGERFYKDFQVPIQGRTPESLSWASIESAKNLLDNTLAEPFFDQGGKGRSYERVDIHFSPMYPQGVRKAAYSLTTNGTVALPVTEKELASVDDISFYTPLSVLKNYRIKGRGWRL